ncbi:response regulator [Bacteriovoracales bacterium]|nr:response regulator [Bacteriovoracales bacterium]
MDISKKFIAIIDDSKPMREAIINYLTKTDFQFIEAVDGEDGIEVVKKNDGKISLLIIDLNMPKLNGIEMMEKLAVNSLGNDIPKILLTSEPPQEFLSLRSRIPNLRGWMVKPIMEQKFIAIVNKILEEQK